MVTRHRGGQQRGQGTVEMALGVLLFVTVFIFGIHFAEVGYLSLKVQEASTSALWDTTSAKMHELPGNFADLQNAIGAAGGHATERIQGLRRAHLAGGAREDCPGLHLGRSTERHL